MQADLFACFTLAARQPNYAFVRGDRGNQQARRFLVHCPIIIKAIDLVHGDTAINLYLIGPVNNPCWLLIEKNNISLRQVMCCLTDV